MALTYVKQIVVIAKIKLLFLWQKKINRNKKIHEKSKFSPPTKQKTMVHSTISHHIIIYIL
jgi:uncharacterized membrane protein